MKHTCSHCSSLFKPTRGHQKYCSRQCYGLAISGVDHHCYKGGSLHKSGYRVVSIKGKHFLEHRLVMEQILGRPLLPTEVVHHKDGDKLNNAPENLEVLGTQSDHAALHYTGFRDDTHKQCKKCLAVKPRTEFGVGSRRTANCDPSHTQCKACCRAYRVERFRSRDTRYHRLQESPEARHLDWLKRTPPHCTACGLTDSPYAAHGMCRRCYGKAQRLKKGLA